MMHRFFNFSQMKEYPVIFSIAGSDSSGGAGIQADIKAISALGGYAAAAITAVTAQNTYGVRRVEYLSAKILEEQMSAVFEDLIPDAVKLGMIGTPELVVTVAAGLRKYAAANVVCDPVMVATSKDSLTMPEAVEVLCREIFPLSTLVTPNIDEASVLAGYRVDSLELMRKAAAELHDKYGCAFLLKGGDMKNAGTSVDVLCSADGLTEFEARRVETDNLHGTGCTLSSSIATLLGKGLPLEDAVAEAKTYVHGAIEAAAKQKIGHGNGPLKHFYGAVRRNCEK